MMIQTAESFNRYSNPLHIPAISANPKVYACDNFDVREYGALKECFNMDLPVHKMYEIHKQIVMDAAIQANITNPAIPTLLQFLQTFLPGQVYTMTDARNIDLLVGRTVQGDWESEEVIQEILEPSGTAVPYGDTSNLALSNWNLNYNYFTNVRFELGMEVLNLEQARSSKANVDSGAVKRLACGRALEIQRNYIGFYGFNNGANRTYGFLNDPNLPNYVIVATGAAASTTWALKTFNEIVADLITAAQAIQTNSGDNIDPMVVPLKLALSSAVAQQLSKINQLGNQSVRQWIAQTYPNWTIVTAPELNAAHSGSNVFYLYPESFRDDSTDDGRVFEQVVPMQFKVQGVERLVKGYREGYTNATCGTFVKRPWAVVRYFGV